MAVTDEHRAALDKRLEHVAMEFAEMRWRDEKPTVPQLLEYLGDMAAALSEFARQVQEEYVRILPVDPEERTPTAAQGVALARVMRGHLIQGTVSVWGGAFALPPGYIAFETASGLHGGISRDGEVST